MKGYKAKEIILRIGAIAETMISVILLVVVVILAFRLLGRMFTGDMELWNMNFWSYVLEYCFNLVIGIEFIRMLLKHSAGSVAEIVLFTIARSMVAEHQDGLETLFLVISLAGVFAIRKYFLLPTDEEDISEAGFISLLGRYRERKEEKNKEQDCPEKNFDSVLFDHSPE